MYLQKALLLEQVGRWEKVKPCLDKLGTKSATWAENMPEDYTSEHYLHCYPWEDGAAIWSNFVDVEAIGMFLVVRNNGPFEIVQAWEQIYKWNDMYFIESNQKRDIDPQDPDPAVVKRREEREKRQAEKKEATNENDDV